MKVNTHLLRSATPTDPRGRCHSLDKQMEHSYDVTELTKLKHYWKYKSFYTDGRNKMKFLKIKKN